MKATDLPIEIQETIQQLLFNQGKYLDQTDIDILGVFQEPLTVPDAADKSKIPYHTLRRRAENLTDLKLLFPIAKKGKAVVYVTGSADIDYKELKPLGLVVLQGRELTLQEFAFMVSRPEYMPALATAVGVSLVHLANRVKDKDAGEEPLEPAPLTVRLMLESTKDQLVEIVKAFEAILRMPIYDDSVGARRYLGAFDENLLKKHGKLLNKNFKSGHVNSRGPKIPFEPTKTLQNAIAKAKEEFENTKTQAELEKEWLNAD